MDSILRAYPKDIRLVFKQFPLPNHSQARLAAEASLAAHAQGKFWPMHDKLFQNSRRLSRESILAFAKEVGLDMEKFTADLGSGKYKAVIAKDLSEGEKIGVNATPTLYVNGKHYNGAIEVASLKPIVDAELKK